MGRSGEMTFVGRSFHRFIRYLAANWWNQAITRRTAGATIAW
ncbi:hypothetical protein FTUN_3564 [Frigoriglobus tundricola]|uniref:Uncharacterized protein n=1 Tax=Frigoriglobus tundricola TaxID=2774151 RepID=A0A6M5YRF2_9BACT|nr:hypothetical protein FTUN_3564 [Frigoriglobus tundricola]